MANDIFKEFNKAFDVEGLQKDIETAKENDQEFDELPLGDYEIAVDKMEIKKSKKGSPMFSAWLKVVSGDYKGRLLFINQVITQGFQLKIVMDFLESLGTDKEITFKDFAQFNDLVLDILEVITGKQEYLVSNGENKKGYSEIKVKEIFDL